MIIQTLQQVKNYSFFTRINNTITRNYKHKGIPVLLQRIVALFTLLLISPILLLVISLIRIESTGGALFSQTRVGENGRHFKMYKFRSMYLKSDPNYQEPELKHKVT